MWLRFASLRMVEADVPERGAKVVRFAKQLVLAPRTGEGVGYAGFPATFSNPA